MSIAFILVRPQMGENIGAAARAMLNFGLTDLRIVAPRDGWPNEKAIEMSSGAFEIIKPQVFENIESAIADLQTIYATSSRNRDLRKEVVETDGLNLDGKIGILFGPERTGLENSDISYAEKILSLNVNQDFRSLNLATSVAVIAYEISKTTLPESAKNTSEVADKKDLIALFEHLESELENRNFYSVPEKKPGMIINIRSILTRASLSLQEVRTLRGIIRCLSEHKKL